MDNFSDAQLISFAIKNNAEALETLIARYLKLVYSFVYRFAQNPADAEDITQEVFVKVWKNLRKYDQSKEFRPWLYKIAKNTCLDFLRKKREIPFSELNNIIEDGEWLSQKIIDSSPRPEALTDTSFLKQGFSNALKRLSPKYSEIITLYHLEELNFREISEKTLQPVNTVKSRYRRAIIKLKNIIGSQ